MSTDGSLNFDTQIETSGFKSGVEKLTKMGTSVVSAVGKSVTAVSAGLLTLGTAATKVGTAYTDSLNKVNTIADTSVKSIAEISASVKQLSIDTGANAAELNESLYQAISAGADTAHAVDLVGVAVKAAKGGFTDTATAVDGLTSVLNTYGMKTEEANALANKFLVTQNLGKTSFGELASSIGSVAPTAAATGVSIEELLSSVASLTANGIGTSEAMTGMKAALSNVIAPTAEAQKAAEEMGIEFSAAALKSKGLKQFLGEIAEATGGDTAQMSRLFGSVEALNSMLILTGNGADLFNKSLNEMETNTTALDDAYNKMTDSLTSDMDKLKAAAEVLGSSFYDSISMPLRELVSVGTDYINQLSEALENGGLEAVSAKLGVILSDAVKTVAGYVPKVAQAAADVINGFIEGIVGSSDEIIAVASDIIDVLIRTINQTVPRFTQTAVEIIGKLAVELVSHAGELTQSAVDIISALAKGISDALPSLVPAAVEAVIQITDTVIDNVDMLGDAALEIITSLSDSLITEDNLKKLVENVPALVAKLVFELTNLAGDLLSVGVEFIHNISKGMESVDFEEEFSTIYDKLYNVGAMMHQELIDGYNNEMREKLAPSVKEWSYMTKSQIMQEMSKLYDEFGGYEQLYNYLKGGGDFADALKEGIIGEDLYNEVYNGIRNEFGETIDDAKTYVLTKLESLNDVREQYDVLTDMLANGEYYGGKNAAITTDLETQASIAQGMAQNAQNAAHQTEILSGAADDFSEASEETAENTDDAADSISELADVVDSTAGEITDTAADTADTLADEMYRAWSEIEHLNALGLDDDETTQKKRLAFIRKYCPEYSDEYYDYYKTVYDYQHTCELESINSTKETLSQQAEIVEDKLSEIADKYKSKYSEIQNNISAYKSKLMSVGETFSVEETTDENGNTTRTLTVNNVAERLAKMKEYHASLLKLRDMGASASLLQEVMSLGSEDGAYMASQLANDPNFAEFNKLYQELDKEAEAMANEFYAPEISRLKSSTSAEIITAYQDLPDELRTVGLQSAKALFDGLASAEPGEDFS
ncbi:MAG: phage tail tape measure protein, partial [Oscillospiraceae bacterium]